jgi:hypothetical protein
MFGSEKIPIKKLLIFLHLRMRPPHDGGGCGPFMLVEGLMLGPEHA